MKRYSRFSPATLARTLALTAAFGAVACTVRKTENSAGNDTATVGDSATIGDSVTTRGKPAPKPGVKAPTTGGERDSATQAVFEIGPDGKVRRVKR